MGDSSGAVTYTLLRGAKYLKDNRLLPTGFDKQTASSDIRAVGATWDTNFVGGSDNVRYSVSGLPDGKYSVRAELVYQTLAHGFAKDLFSDTVTPEVVDFKAMYDATPEKATVIAAVEFTVAFRRHLRNRNSHFHWNLQPAISVRRPAVSG